MQQNAGMSRSLGGGDHDAAESSQPEGSVADTARQQGKEGDLSQFGKTSMGTTPTSFGRGDSPSNMPSMPQNPDAVVDPSSSEGSRFPDREPSADLDTGAQSEPAPQRQELQLLPWPKPVGEEPTFAESEAGSDNMAGEISGALVMSKAEAGAKIDGDTKEFSGAPMHENEIDRDDGA